MIAFHVFIKFWSSERITENTMSRLYFNEESDYFEENAVLWVCNKIDPWILVHEGLYINKSFEQKYPSFCLTSQALFENPSLKMFLLKLYWTKLKSPKSSKLVKVDNRVIIVLIFINLYFALIYHPHHQRPPQMVCYHKF